MRAARSNVVRTLAFSALCVGTAAAQPAVAPDSPPAAAGSHRLEEIVVTAQRRAERLQDVPISVTSVAARVLANAGVASVTDLKVAVPAFNATNSNGYFAPRLRGIGSTATGPGIENSVAVYVDGVYYAASVASILSLNNIARVEVLKGPQGTLFGRNSTGGLIQVITRTPTQTRTAEMSVTYANYRTVQANAYLSGGIADGIAADFAAQYTHEGAGWGRNLGTGHPSYAIDHDASVRSKIVYDPGTATKVTLSGDYENTDNSLNSDLLLPGTVANPGEAPARYPGRWDTDTNHDSITKGWQAGGSVRVDQKLGGLSFVSLSAYRESRYTRAFDFDLTANPQPNPRPSIPYRYFVQPQPDRQFSQEVQLLSPSGGRFTWVVGGYYFDASSGYDPLQIFFEAPFGPVAPQGQLVSTYSRIGTQSIAGFGQGTLALGARTNLTLGMRYTHETRDVSATQQRALIPSGTPAPIGPIPPQPDIVANKPSFRAALDHHFAQNLMAYASFNRGFKSGGFTAGSPGAPGFQPEEVDAYELGVKTELFDRRLRLGLAGFHDDYTNIQIQVVGPTGTVTINGPSARINGFDSDFEARLTDNLRVSGGLQLIDDRFGTFDNALISQPQGGVNQVTGSATGHRLPLIASTTFSITPQYTIPLASGAAVDLNATYYYNSGWFAEADNVIRQPAFSQYNASVRWTLPGGNLSLLGWGKNLSDARTFAAEVTVPGGRHFTIWNEPRTYGITLAAKF